MEELNEWETMGYAKHCFEELVKCMEKMEVEWWVRMGWSMRKLPPDALTRPVVDDRQQEFMYGPGEVDHREAGGEDVGGRREELRRSGGAAGGQRAAGASFERRLVREALAKKATPGRRRRGRKGRR